MLSKIFEIVFVRVIYILQILPKDCQALAGLVKAPMYLVIWPKKELLNFIKLPSKNWDLKL